MHKKTCELIRKQEAHYVIGLKANREALYSAAEALCATARPLSVWEETEHTRDRQIRRNVQVFAAPAVVPFTGYQDTACVVLVEREGTRGGKPYHEKRFHISSRVLEAQAFAQVIRKHWNIENGLHWAKDVVLKEDACTTRAGQAAENLALVRSWVVTCYRNQGYRSITSALRRFAHDFPALFAFIRE